MLYVDGKPCSLGFDVKPYRNGLCEVFVYGKDIKSRVCRVSCYTLPAYLFERGGKVKTSGHTFECRKEEQCLKTS